jgi:tetratricopeptide (TPR) repeat protein
MSPLVRFTAALALAACVSYGILHAARLTYADHLAQSDNPAALQAASRIEPLNAGYRARIATVDSLRDDQLQAALRLNPRNPSWWIMESIHREETGDLAGAEKCLLQANSVSRYYTPRWTAAFFYYRQNNRPEFVRWARAGLSVGYGESESLLRMAQKLGLTSAEILRDVIPEDPDKVAAYLEVLNKDHAIDRTYEPAAKLIGLGAKPWRNLILGISETLFQSGRIDQALDLWNRTVQAGWVAFSKLDPAAGKSIARNNFRGERIERGFDWKYPVPQGVSVSVDEPDGSLRLDFSGKEPTSCELASQYTALPPGRRYRLAVRARSASIPPGSGLQWSVVTVPGGQRIAAVSLDALGGPAAEQSIVFETPQTPAPLRLMLSYSRNLGTTRIEGTLWVESVELAVSK